MSSSSRTNLDHDQAKNVRRQRRIPIGAELVAEDRTHFRIWAPAARAVAVVISGQDGESETTLEAETNGYFSAVAHARAGDRYWFRLDGGDRLFPDPSSRFQPDGPHQASQIVDPSFAWTDEAWRGVTLEGQIIYELHVGTFTHDGTWQGATRELPELASAGISIVEVLPVSEFDGRFGWGYDGVDLFAPFHGYGTPDDFRRFVDRAHALGLGVILDVVYNHFGPSGNYLRAFSAAYFSNAYQNEWGEAINFDGPDSEHVRELFVANAGYWIDEYHVDGLRLDATQQVYDRSPTNIMAEIGRRVRESAGGRSTIVVAENETQDVRLIRPTADGGYGLDGLWNDDFHHSAMVALTGRREAYYTDTRGEPQELISAVKYGCLFQGQFYSWQCYPRGTAALDISPARFVTFLQNHDQVANSAAGVRVDALTSPAKLRAMTALLLLSPCTPMLFQGQEFGASTPFFYFADFEGELADAVRRGRSEFMSQFPSAVAYERSNSFPDPADPATVERSKLDLRERETHAAIYDLHKDLIKLRRGHAAFTAQRRGGVDGAVLSAAAFALRFLMEDSTEDRLLLVNLGAELNRESLAEPLIAPPQGSDWQVIWSSDEPRYGGCGARELWVDGRWSLPAESALVLAPGSRRSWKEPKFYRRSA